MACCGLDKDKPLYVVIPIVAAVLGLALAGGLAVLLLSPFSRRCRRATRVIWLYMLATVKEVKERVIGRTYILSPRFRCVISGRLMRLNPWLGGVVYKRLGTLCVSALIVIGAGLWLALR